ncbi:MAG: hypothetical protein WBE83_10850, partial [Candidatus Cybelea sp.]
MKRSRCAAANAALRECVAPERRLRVGDARGVHAADIAFERIRFALAAVSISRGAPNRELARSMEELCA